MDIININYYKDEVKEEFMIGNDHGQISNNFGVSLTDDIGDEACANVLEAMKDDHTYRDYDEFMTTLNELVSLQPQPPAPQPPAPQPDRDWMLLHMPFSESQHTVRQDVDSIYEQWAATRFNPNLLWNHAEHRWVNR